MQVKHTSSKRTYLLPKLDGKRKIRITGNTLKKYSWLISGLSSIVFLTAVFLITLITKLITVLLAILPAIIAAKILKSGLRYSNLFNLGVFGITPFLFLETLLRLFYYYSRFAFMILYVIYAVFIIYILKTLKDSESEAEAEISG